MLQFNRNKLPFGIAQVGKSFRNEISPRNFLIRLREFTQMELELFVNPNELNDHPRFDEVADVEIRFITREQQENGDMKPRVYTAAELVENELVPNQYIAYYLAKETLFLEFLGVPKEDFWFRHMTPQETPHYSGGNFDLEVNLSIGPVEIIGNAYRRDYDLKHHMEASNTKMEVTVNSQKIIPHVIEPSFGIERIIYTILEKSFRKTDDRTWNWFDFPPSIAPIELAVFPLMKKDGLDEYSWELYRELKEMGFIVIHDVSGKIGKRYARADEIGIPFCITVDYQTLEDNTVTIRYRNTTDQVRVHVDELSAILEELVSETVSFEELVEELKEDSKA